MKLLYCGFNAFQQINEGESKKTTKAVDFPVPTLINQWNHPKSDVDLWIGWSRLITVVDGLVTVSGLWNDKSGFLGLVGEDGTRITKIAATEKYLVGIDNDGNLRKLSCTSPQSKWEHVPIEAVDDKAHPAKFVKISSNENSVLALDSEGILYLPPDHIEFPAAKFVDISCGKEHFMALSEDGSVYTWGIGSRGQLGHGTINSCDEPTQVEALGGVRMVQIAAGGWHSCCLSESGDVYIWGWNESGQLALPYRKTILEPASSSAESGSWPSEEYVSVQCEPRLLDHPIPFSDGHVNVTCICCGARHTAVILADKSAWSWGWNAFGQLGSGDRTSRHIPVRVLDSADGVTCGPWSTAWWTDATSVGGVVDQKETLPGDVDDWQPETN